MKEKILKFIRENEHVTYVELERLFERNNYNYKGDFQSSSDSNPNVIFWTGWSTEAFGLIHELVEEKKIERCVTDMLTYLIDGKCPTLPIVKKDIEKYTYKNLHWLPIVFNPVY